MFPVTCKMPLACINVEASHRAPTRWPLDSVPFQQVQKYEKGSNRVSASRLVVIANTLGLPPSYFFRAEAGRLPSIRRRRRQLVSFIATNEGRDLNVAFARILSTTTRRKIVGLVTALAVALERGCRRFRRLTTGEALKICAMQHRL